MPAPRPTRPLRSPRPGPALRLALRVGAIPLLLGLALGLAGLGGGAERSALAEPRAQAQPPYELLDQLGGPVNAVAAVGHLAYVGVGPRVWALDLCDPAYPLLLGQSPVLPGIVDGLALRGDRAFVALRAGGLGVLDVSDPAAMALTARRDVYGLAAAVFLDGARAYVLAGAGGMAMFDVAQPDAPRPLGTFASIISDADAEGDWAYVVSRNLKLVGVADPAAAFERAKMAEWADAVAVRDGWLYVGESEDPIREDRQGRFRIYDVRDPDRNRPLVGGIPVGTPVRDVLLQGSTAWLLTRDQLRAVDVAQPTKPRILRSRPVPEHYRTLATTGRHLLVAAGAGGLVAYDQATLTETPVLAPLGRASALTSLPGASLVEDDGARPGEHDRLLSVSSDPRAAARLAGLPLRVDQRAIAARGTMAYVGGPDQVLRVLDLSDPAAPRERGSLELPKPIWALAPAAEGDVLLVANDDRLRSIDVSDPDRPREIAQIRVSWGATDLAVDGGRAYVTGPESQRETGRDTLHVLDVSEPGHLRELGRVRVDGWNAGLAAKAGYVYVGGLQVVDARDPASPVFLSDAPIETEDGGRLRLRGKALESDTLLVAVDLRDGGGFLEAYDVADPAQPRSLGRVDTLDAALGVTLQGGVARVAAGDAGLLSLGRPGAVPAPTTAPVPTPFPAAARIHIPIVARGPIGPTCR